MSFFSERQITNCFMQFHVILEYLTEFLSIFLKIFLFTQLFIWKVAGDLNLTQRFDDFPEFHEHCAMVQMPDEWGARVPNKAGLRRLYVSSEKTDWGTVESGLVF